jgi:hypothetical protein
MRGFIVEIISLPVSHSSGSSFRQVTSLNLESNPRWVSRAIVLDQLRKPKIVPQTGRPGFDEFLELEHRPSDFATARNRTKRATVMRRDARRIGPVKGLSFSERDDDFFWHWLVVCYPRPGRSSRPETSRPSL